MPFDTIRLGSSASTGDYTIRKSLRCNEGDEAHLTRTFDEAGNRRTFTLSSWFKFNKQGNQDFLWMVGSDSNNQFALIREGVTQINFECTHSSSQVARFYTSNMLRDFGSWYHFVLAIDTTQSTDTDRMKFYINGVEATMGGQSVSTAYPTQNLEFLWGQNSVAHYIAKRAFAVNTNDWAHLYLADSYYIDGLALAPTAFAETHEDTGQWVPKRYSGSYGNAGYKLDFSDSSNTTAATLGKDSSGNGNNWTPNNYSVSAGAGNDSFEDTPSNNWCTLNPNDNGGITLSDGNLVTNVSSGFKLVKSTFFLTTGKWYWEVICTDTGNGYIGVSDQDDALNNRGGGNATSCTIAASDGDKRISGSDSSYGSAISDGDVMMFAVDMDAGKFWAGKSGTWFNSGNPATGANAGSTAITNPVSPSVSLYDNEDYTMNFGANMDFAHTPPTGFNKINTSNLPEPSIVKPSDHFDILTYTGNGSTQSITGLSFQPELVWTKERNGSDDHALWDTMRGVQKKYVTHSTADQVTVSDGLTSFESNGFNVGANGVINQSSQNYVAFCWNGGSSAVAEEAGSINASVRANTTAGFSNLSYVGNATAGATVEHGLNAVPQWMIIKRTSDNWIVYHHKTTSSPEDDYYEWQQAGNINTSGAFMWNNTLPTSSVFTLYSDGSVNASGETIYWWGWNGVEGFSKFGSYTGNGAADGTFVWTGFKPAFLLTKYSSGHWVLWHNKVEGYNPTRTALLTNANNPEEALDAWAIDFYSNGFKLRGTSVHVNGNGSHFIYMAFAEQPFKYANAR